MTDFDEEPKFRYELQPGKNYTWQSHGYIALVTPKKTYKSSDPNQQVRVRVLAIRRRPKRKGFDVYKGETIPVWVDELKENNK